MVEVHERKIDDITLAFATVYNPHFRDRQFLQNSDAFYKHFKLQPPVGVCIEGIRVEFMSPGFGARSGILCIVDCKGNDAPKTNVARSALESEADQNSLITSVFDVYLKQVQDEISRLQQQEGFSQSYAVDQFPFIAGPLYANSRGEKPSAETFRKFPMVMLEDDKGPRAASIAELHELDGFWTVESLSMSSLVQLLKETTAKVTCKQVAEFAGFKGAPLPPGNLITTSYFSAIPRTLLENEFEICELRASIADRRIDAKWSSASRERPRWINSIDVESATAVELRDELRHFRRMREDRPYHARVNNIQIAIADFPKVGLDEYFAVMAMNVIRILPGTALSDFLISLDYSSNPLPFLIFLDALGIGFSSTMRLDLKYVRSEVEYSLKETTARLVDRVEIDTSGFLRALGETEGRLLVFNPWSWERTENRPDEF